MVRAQRVASILVTLSLVLSLGVLAPPAAGTVAADPAEIHVYSGDSIQDAIDAAAPGDIIIVHPGTYEEPLTIDKSLTVVSSDGAAETIIYWFDYPSNSVTISLSDGETVVFGREGAGFNVLDGDDGMDVTVEYWSSVTVEGNTFTNCNDAVEVNAVRYFSDLTFNGNTVDYAWGSGIYFYTDSVQYHSSVDIVDNTITDCAYFGVGFAGVGDDSHALVQGNTIDSVEDGAVHFEGVFDRSSVDIIDNQISNSTQTCIYVEYLSELSEGRILGNDLSVNPNASAGISIPSGLDDAARLTIEGNTITGNLGQGCNVYEVKNGSYLAVVDNQLNDNVDDGLYIEALYYGSECVIQGNSITGNGSDGVYIYGDLENGGLLTVENNTITGNYDYGFYIVAIHDRSRLDMLDNEISGNRVGAYLNDISNLSECRFEGNTISNNGEGEYDDGVYVAYVNAGARLYLDDNDIKGNGGHGLELGSAVYYGAVISLTDNDISDNLDCGVYISDVYDGSECLFQGNTITGNGGSGVYVDSSNDEYGSRITVQDNTISGNDEFGLYVASLTYGAYLGVLNNQVKDNDDDGVRVGGVTEGSECIVTDNTVSGNAHGVYVDWAENGSLLDFEDNDVTGNSDGGISCGGQVITCEVKVLGNSIVDNTGIGLLLCQDGGDLSYALSDSRATVRCNTISGNSSWGISAYIYRSLVDVSGNRIIGNGAGSDNGGIYVSGDLFQVVGIHQNSIAGNADWGLQNGGSDVLDATENWWGDDSGPYHGTTNPGGLGDDVSDDVNYDDWLDMAPALCATYVPDVPAPATITVDDSGGADYTSIQDAIDAADPGDLILVSPGTYTEDLSIDGSLTVKSTGGAGVTLIEGTVNLDVDYELSMVVFGGVDAGFTVSGSGAEGIYVDSESWSHVTIQGNIITGCWNEGILVSGAGVRCFSSLSILDNEIRANGSSGASLAPVRDFSSVGVNRNAITDNAMYGVYLYSDWSGSVVNHSSAVIVDNDITDNAGDGVYFYGVFNNSSGLVQGNTISGNGDDGFEFYEVQCGSTLNMVDNEIRDNDYSGVYGDNISLLSHASMSENTIAGNEDYGVYMYAGPSEGGRVTLEDNTITGNEEVGFYIDQSDVMYGGYLALLSNEISDNGSYGVNIFGFYEGGEGLISGNTIRRNGSYGVYIEEGVTYGAALTVQENTIEDNQGYGVYVNALESGSYLALLDNQVNRNWPYGVYLYDCYAGSEALIEGNTFTANDEYGLLVSDDVSYGCRMTILGNTFTDHMDSACAVASVYFGSSLDLRDNEATGGDGEGFDLTGYYEGSQGIISGNSISGAGGDGIYVYEVQYGCVLTVEKNTFSGNGDNGFDCRSDTGYGSYLAIVDNRMEGNSSDGLYIYDIRDGAEAVIRGNVVGGNTCGVNVQYMRVGGKLTVEDNDISGNSDIGLWLCGVEDTLADSEAAVLGNVISGNGNWGIESNIRHAMVDISGCNKVEDNPGGIHIFGSELGMLHINNNNIEGNIEWGLLNQGSETIDATDNWWGDPSGPLNSDTNPVGLGDEVSGDVEYEPWLTQTCSPSNLVAAMKASPRSGKPGLTVHFTDLSTTACEVVEWLWDFGDGDTSTEQNPRHTYRREGTFNVTLTVRDACGYTATVRMKGYITVAEDAKEEAPESADLGVSYLLVDPVQVLPNQEVTVSANVCNQGEERGSKTVSLMVNGVAEQSQSVGVSGGSCQQVVFRVSRAVPGTYQVAIDGMSGTFSVLAPRTVQASVPSQQDTGLGTAGIVAIIAVMLALIGALVVLFRRS